MVRYPFIILTPTDLERKLLIAHWLATATRADVRQWVDWIQVAGFGPIASGIYTAQLLQSRRIASVLLIGIGGALCDEVAIGSAYLFRQVAIHGIGVGQGQAHQSAAALGWPQAGWGSRSAGNDDCLSLAVPLASQPIAKYDLLTVCCASADEAEAAERRRRFPRAAVEDMEGWSVALACHLAGIPLVIIRGVSNRAGDREHAHWDIPAAISAAADLAMQIGTGAAAPDLGEIS